ncbi:MAG: 3'-5' exonuclease [Candidatus Thermoplasmatota archaeon]|nr:3'-5' exonuclease [Candidatus Thermoplasmatota archaeon]
MPESRSKAEAAWVRFDEPEENSSSTVDALSRSQGHVELVVNYRTAAGLLNRMNEWWEDLFSPIHDRFPGDWYARPQALIPARAKAEGRFEWLLPASELRSGHPDAELANPLDPFSSGTSSEMENALITARIRALIDGQSTRVGEEIQPEQAPLSPGDILVLLPSRTHLGDLMTRLEVAGIPATADKEGGLLLRPVIRPLLGLIQWIARPTSRHAAATVARSSLIGLNDGELQSFLLEAERGENLIERLAKLLADGPHRALVENWHQSSQRGSVIEILSDTLNHGDLLIAHPRPSERNDAEQFLHLVETQSLEVGGDPILLADRISHLADVAGNDLTSANQSSSDSVQIMTIHGSKGLQRKCVIVGGLFSEGQGNISHDLRQRVIATPSLFASNPRPWKSHSNLDSGIWTLARTLQEAQIQAEARRLFYVACTRVKDLLILAGGPNDSIRMGNTVSIKPRSVPMPTFGHMWFDALGWQPGEDGRHFIDPQSSSFTIHTHESELVEATQNISPLVRMSRLHEAAKIAHEEVSPVIRNQVNLRTRGCKISPHQLDKASTCPRCYLQLMKLGLSPSEIQTHTGTASPSASEKIGLPPANVIGSIFHRVVEIGLENPEIQFELSTPLPSQWTQRSPDLLSDDNVIQSVLKELMPPDADKDALKSLLKQMSEAVKKGPLGTLTSGNPWNGEMVEGLRTEWPFSLQIPIEISADEHMWTPHGPHPIAHIEQFMFSVSGIADLVLCTKMKDGKGAIRAVDLKTTAAAHLYAGWSHPLLEAEGESRHPAEQDMLGEYRMQLALYTLSLTRQEEARKRLGIPYREVLPPAILCATTGRMIVMTEVEMQTALEDLESLLETLGKLALEGDIEHDCDCPLNLSNIRLSPPAETESA